MLTKKITKAELLVVAAARQIKNGDVVVLGVGLRSMPAPSPRKPMPPTRSWHSNRESSISIPLSHRSISPMPPAPADMAMRRTCSASLQPSPMQDTLTRSFSALARSTATAI